ncbi:MAG: FkbM family methyltransferase [Methylacidiphilales bacterium]|nr:FkbM family methyltransferase [Candidatus Methylacidiphilales bacterium]
MNSSSLRPVAFVAVSTNHGTMLVNRHDYRITSMGGYGVGFQLLNRSAFDPEEVSLALQLLHTRRENFGDGVVAIDCGANIGVHTIEWARFMYGWGEVIAFEAQERIYYALAGNIAMNNCFNARAVWAAVGESVGTIRVPKPNYLEPASFGSLEIRKTDTTEFIGQDIDYSDEGTIETQMMPLDALSLKRLDFIKIDIEGMEMDALKGARKYIELFKPQMIIEKIKANEGDISDFIKAIGYNIYPVGINLLAIHESDPACKLVKQ